jgi:hypothetical protein
MLMQSNPMSSAGNVTMYNTNEMKTLVELTQKLQENNDKAAMVKDLISKWNTIRNVYVAYREHKVEPKVKVGLSKSDIDEVNFIDKYVLTEPYSFPVGFDKFMLTMKHYIFQGVLPTPFIKMN